MVGERVQFLFTCQLLQAHLFACSNLLNKNRMRSPTISILPSLFNHLYSTHLHPVEITFYRNSTFFENEYKKDKN